MKRELMTTAEAAKYLHMSRAWVYDHSERSYPRLPVIHMGGRNMYDANELDKFVDQLAELSARRASK
jgi:hypothetical protein